jgi:hypothetical protein
MKKTIALVSGFASVVACAVLFFGAPSTGLAENVAQGCRQCVREFCKDAVQDCRQTGDITSPECQQALLCVQANCGAVCVLP